MTKTTKEKNKARQLSFAGLSDDLQQFIGRKGWTLIFKPCRHGRVMAVSGRIDEIYSALNQWTRQHPDYYSAIIYRPNGKTHRTIKNEEESNIV